MKDKKIVWITGASSGIGRAAAIEFSNNGFHVFASSRKLANLESLKNEIDAKNDLIEIFECDVSSSTDVEKCVKIIFEKTNRIDCLINNAGITSFKSAAQNSVNEIDEIISTNLLGSIYSVKSVLPKMIEQKEGLIINILSVVVKKTFQYSSVYAASKSGLLAYSNVLREENRKHGIRVVNVIPGATDTPIWSDEKRKEFSNRMMKPENIAKILVDVATEKNNIVQEEIVLRPIEGDL